MPESKRDKIATAILDTLMSPNELDRNMENANVVDGLFAIARAISRLAKAVEGLKERQEDGPPGEEDARW